MTRFLQKLILPIIASFSVCVSVGSAAPLSVVTVGTGTPQYDDTRSGPSALIQYGDKNYLVDMGNGTQARLHELGLNVRQLSGVLITHHHIDHNEEFIPIYMGVCLAGGNAKVIGPPGTKTLSDFTLKFYSEDIAYRLKRRGGDAAKLNPSSVFEINGGETFALDQIKVTTAKVNHTIHTVAYRFDAEGKSIVISGDTAYSEELIELARGADVLVMDSGAAIVLKEGMGGRQANNQMRGARVRADNTAGGNERQRAHASVQEVGEMAEKAGVKKLVLTHIVPGEVDATATLAGLSSYYSGEVVIAHDKLNVNLGESQQKVISEKAQQSGLSYPIVDTAVTEFYNNASVIPAPKPGEPFYGQDAQFQINKPSYTDNGDGTITDEVTGLMWQKVMNNKMTFTEAFQKAAESKLAYHDDWRVPTIKELYSLIQFTGRVEGAKAIELFIDTKYFDQPIGDSSKGEREIDAQTWSSTEYVGRTMNNNETVFGVNFVDGRIKGYPKYNPRSRQPNQMYFRFVRGNKNYGINQYIDNKNDTITDVATGLMWQKSDSGQGMNWEKALSYAENLTSGGYSDWRLPNAKELQSIADYTRSPQTSGTAAIDPVFETSAIKDPEGNRQYPYFWTSTTHLDGRNPYSSAAYIAFGDAQGKMNNRLMDAHGAGAQRSDPKTGSLSDYPQYFGPQGDLRYVFNYARCVRTAN